MKLKPAICPQCKATLSVEEGKEKAICPYCNKEFPVSNAIKSFNTTYNITGNDVPSNDTQYISPNDFTIIAGVLEKYTGSCVNVKIPNTVKIISYKAFKDCYGLESVEFPKGVQRIGGFSNCESLETINIPNTVETLSGFSGCTNLKNIYIAEGVKEISTNAFTNCTSLEEIVIPASVKTLGGFSGCTNLKKIYIAEGVKKISSGAFTNCHSLKEIVIPASVETIGYNAFDSCYNLEIVTIKNINTCLDYWECDEGGTEYPFRFCIKIKQLNAPLDWKKRYYHVFDITRNEYAPPKTQTKGCYIATSVYGSYDCPEVWILRRYRDNVLSNTFYGRIFIKIYYRISPILVNRFGNSKLFSCFFKIILDRCIEHLQKRGLSNAYYNDEVE